MGNYFRSPRLRKKRDWEQLRRLAEHGFRFPTKGSFAWVRFVLASTTGGRLDARLVIASCSCHTHKKGQRRLRQIALKAGRRRKAGR